MGDARALLEGRGLWDDALVVVTADHGVHFEPGATRAVGIGSTEVTSVPLFVKRPHQTKGRIDDRAALTIDLVPTVLGRLGVSSPSRFDGLDLYRDDVPASRSGAFLAAAGDEVTPRQDREALARVVGRRARWIDPEGGWMPVFQPAIAPVIVRADVADLDLGFPAEGTFRRSGSAGGSLVRGRLDVPDGDGWLALGCGGQIAGLTAVADQVSLFLDDTVCGPNDTVEAWLVDAEQILHPLRSTR